MYTIAGKQPEIVRTFILDYVERSISEHAERPISIIIRKKYLPNHSSSFGYYRPLVGGRLRRMAFKYLDSIERIITFLLGITEMNTGYKIQNIVIEDLQQYIGNNLIQALKGMIVLFNVLERVKSVMIGKGRQFGNIGVTIIGDQQYLNKIRSFVCRRGRDFIEIMHNQDGFCLMKNKERYESSESNKFFGQFKDFSQKMAN